MEEEWRGLSQEEGFSPDTTFSLTYLQLFHTSLGVKPIVETIRTWYNQLKYLPQGRRNRHGHIALA